MNENPFNSTQLTSAKGSRAGRPEPEYVDEVFEDEVFTDDVPEEAVEPQASRKAPVDDSGSDAAADAKPLLEFKPEPAAASASPRMPGPTHRVTGRSAVSRIPHRLEAPDRGVGKSSPVNPPRASGPSAPAAKAEIPAWVLLEDILKNNEDLPEGSLILGVQEDGRPLVLSMDDTSIGAVLITGDAPAANRKHLRAILASAEKLCSPELLQVDVIDRTGEGVQSNSSILRRNCAAADPCVFEILGEYLAEIETRLRDERKLPFRVLILDEIEELTGRLAEDSLRFLRWMMRRGSQVGIWIFASIETARLPEFDSKTFRAFDLRLYGKIREKTTAERYTEISPQLLKKLAAGTEGCFKLDDDVIRFSIPEFAG